MKVLISGVAGFIGSSLAETLLRSSDYEIIGLDSLTDYYAVASKRSNLRRLTSSRFTLVEDDLNTADLPTLLRDVEVIYHQAGQPGVRKSWGRDFSGYLSSNIAATQVLLEAATKASSLKSFVYASSSSVYGDAERFPTMESDRPMPRSPYGVTKLAAENLCSLYASNFGLPTVSLRYFTVYGPRQRPDMAFNRFIRAALEDREISVYGNGEQVREFTHVSDIVRANILASKAGVRPGEIINLSGGSSVTVNDVLELVQDIHGSPLKVVRSSPIPGDVGRTGGSTEKAQRLLGWAPSTEIQDGLRSEYEWLAEDTAGGTGGSASAIV